MKNIYTDTELVVPVYNAHPYFSLTNLGKTVHLYMAKYSNCFFSLAAFKILSSLTFGTLIMMCFGLGLFASILFGILCASWTCMSISFTRLRKFAFSLFSHRFPISCSFSSPSGTPMMQTLGLLKLSQRLFILSSLFWILFHSCCSDWLFFASLFQIIDLILRFIHSTVVSL